MLSIMQYHWHMRQNDLNKTNRSVTNHCRIGLYCFVAHSWGPLSARKVLNAHSNEFRTKLYEYRHSLITISLMMMRWWWWWNFGNGLISWFCIVCRIIWFMIFMCAFGFFIYYAYSRISFYLSFTMSVSVEVNFLSKMPFPAVTFCNENSFKYGRRQLK